MGAMTTTPLTQRALSAYYRSTLDTLDIYEQPGDVDIREYNGRQYVVLSNVRGTLAVYRVRTDGILKRLRRWPLAVAD